MLDVRGRRGRGLGWLGLVLGLVASTQAGGPPALRPPDADALAEARRLVDEMRRAERGPYLRLRWFCRDGSILPPAAYACKDHGGGRQHGEYSPARQRLAALGWSVGTVLAALTFDELFDAGRRHQRLRELLVERYLTEGGDGWVLARARTYRGRIQVEDEEAMGRALLIRLLAQPGWDAGQFLLAREAVRSLPHHGGVDRTREIRRLSQEVAEAAPGFEPLRVRIHSAPGARDLTDVRAWFAGPGGARVEAPVRAKLDALVRELDRLYGPGRDPLAEARAIPIPASAPHAAWLEGLGALPAAGHPARLRRLADALVQSRELVGGSVDGAADLAVLDASMAVERVLMDEATAALAASPSRRDLLALSRVLVDAVYGVGLLSGRARDAVAAELDAAGASRRAALEAYAAAARALRRSLTFSAAEVRATFAEPLARYVPLEPRAGRFIDELLRGSPALPLGVAAARWTEDADRLQGRVHRILGEETGGAVGQNPGVAIGTLRWVDAVGIQTPGAVRPDDVVVLPDPISELPPVAGILSLAEGSLLSHVQLLARNLGIPNATLSPRLGRRLRELDGARVVMVVGSRGSVVLERVEDLPEALAGLATSPTSDLEDLEPVAAPVPDLTADGPIPLEELSSKLSGKVVGPKAANLGELARLFPGRVEQALALPFGEFHRHTDVGPRSPRKRLDAAYQRHRDGQLDDVGLTTELASIREAIAASRLDAGAVAALRAEMHRAFGPPGSYGVFVRSDTNVEDLPGFTGAGLNLTVPHVVGVDAILAAVPKVWASVLSPRAIGWRSTLLSRPEDVYSSVLIMKSVPAEKSGVLVTRNLAEGGEGLTISMGWGVGGAVDGEAAETVVLRPDGSTLLLAEAQAPYCRALDPKGGVRWVPAPAGTVVGPGEERALRAFAVELGQRLTPSLDQEGQAMPWDVELGFVGGQLALFQVRPLVERGQDLADRVVDALTPPAPVVEDGVDLEAPPYVSAGEGDL